MSDLKLLALEPQDLAVVSMHLQDAVLTVGDIAYLPRETRFVALFNRFDWVDAHRTDAPPPGAPPPGARNPHAYTRRRTALRFERVTAARLKNIDLNDKKRVMNLLAIQYEPASPDDPAGFVSLIFAADAAIRLDVDYIEAEMRDLGAVWATGSKPAHPDQAT